MVMILLLAHFEYEYLVAYIHMQICKLEFIRHIFMYMSSSSSSSSICHGVGPLVDPFVYQMMLEGILILRLSSINDCLVWLLKFFHVNVVDLLWS